MYAFLIVPTLLIRAFPYGGNFRVVYFISSRNEQWTLEMQRKITKLMCSDK